MKKLNKLKINPEKVIKHDELVNLTGGAYGGCCICFVGGVVYGPTSSLECAFECQQWHPGNPGYFWEC